MKRGRFQEELPAIFDQSGAAVPDGQLSWPAPIPLGHAVIGSVLAGK